MTNTTKTLWGGYYYETDGHTYWKTGENWDTDKVEISEAEYNEAMTDRQDYYDHRDIYDNDEQLLWDIEMEAAIEEETDNPMTSAVETGHTENNVALQEIAQEMAEMQKAMEQSGDTETQWTTTEIARQDLQERWDSDAEAAGLDPEDTETRDQLWDMVIEAYYTIDPDTDPVGAVVAHIQRHAAGLVRHDLDAKNNGWDPYEDPESGYVWQEAERQLLAASGDEELDDDTYDALCEATWSLLLDDEEEE